MICQRCQKEVPPGKIACECFKVHADEETRLHALVNFKEGKAPLYLTNANNGKHLLARRNRTRSFCGMKEFKEPTTTPVWLHLFNRMAQHDTCITCAAIVKQSFGAE